MPSPVENQFDEVRIFVEQDRLDEALDSLAKIEGFQACASSFRSRLSRLEEQRRKRTLPREAAEAARNQLTDDILGLIFEDSLSNLDDNAFASAYVPPRPAPTAPPFFLYQDDIKSFTGRQAELQQLEAVIFNTEDDPRLAGIAGLTGAGGIGKSALAFHFATIHKDRFPDGVIGLPVEGDLEAVAQRFAWHAEAQLPTGVHLSAPEIMKRVFAKKRALLIFDNVEDAAVKLLPPGGRCAVIITTRDNGLLRNLEIPEAHRLPLDPFTLAEMQKLLGELIGSQRVAAEPEAVEQIYELVGGLPLAIRIVGETLADQSFTALAEFAGWLADEKAQLKLLRDPEDKDLDVEASFELSLKRLDDPAIKAFACLGACPRDGFSLLAAEVVTGEDKASVNNIMGRLTRLSLVNRGDQADRFTLHPLLFVFARRKAEANGWLADAEQRHTDFFLTYVQDHQHPSPDNISALSAELNSLLLTGRRLAEKGKPDYNFYVALEPFLETSGNWSKALDLIALYSEAARAEGDFHALAQFALQRGQFLQLRGKFREAEAALLEGEAFAARIENHYRQQRTKAMVLNSLGGVYQRQGNFAQAVAAFEQSRQISERLGDERGLAMVLNSLGGVYQRQGNFAQAIAAFERGRQINEKLGDERGLAMVLNSLGGVYQRQGNFAQAIAAFERGRQINEKLGDERSLAMVLNSLGGVYQRQGNFAQAVAAFERGRQINEKLGDERSLAMVLNSLGGVYQRQGNFAQAIAAFERGRQINEKLGDERSLAMMLNSLGGVYQRQGSFAQAVAAFEQSQQIRERLGDEHGLAMVLNSLGGVYQRQGNFAQAIAAFEQSQQISEKLGDERGLAMVLNSLGGVYQRQGKFELAASTFERSKLVEEKLGNERGQAMVLNSLGGIYQRQGNFAQAIAAFEQSQQISEKLGDERGLAMVLNSLGGVYQRLENYAEAIVLFKRSADIERKFGNLRGLAMALSSLSGAYRKQDTQESWIEAVYILKQSEEIEEKLGNQRGQAMILNSLGDVYQRLGDFDQAIAVLRQSYDLLVSLKDMRGQAMVLTSLGKVCQQNGDLEAAVEAFRQSAEIEERINNRRGLAMVLCAWGKALLNHNDPQQAAEKLTASFEIDESLRNVKGLRIVTPSLVRALTIGEREGDARDYVNRALAIAPTDKRLLTVQQQLAEGHPVSSRTIIKTGTVSRLIRNRAGYLYGFIVPDDESKDIYFGEESINPTLLSQLTEGAKVTVEVELSARGPRARRVWQDARS